MIAEIRSWVRKLVGSGPDMDSAINRRAIGNEGERIAERHLKRCGYRIVGRNFRAAGAEIDLIALDGATLVFVEVKWRRSDRAGAPEDAVDGRKQERIRRAAEIYAVRHRAGERELRFDVIAISPRNGRHNLDHLKDAF